MYALQRSREGKGKDIKTSEKAKIKNTKLTVWGINRNIDDYKGL